MCDTTATPAANTPPPRRKPSTRRARNAQNGMLSNSLRANRNGGLASTKGRLSVSFSDQKGLSAALIGDILSGVPDESHAGDQEKSMAELLGVPDSDDEDGGGPNNKSFSSLGTSRMKLMTIKSQRSVNFSFDPKDLEESDEED
mmetsp:Transcript_31765/g.60679  ORF Transcript_31765/g.60679 Transcript_31765/m.60679 type:complete len:144 (+) Transcript_31765:131-562(+)